MMFAKLDEAKFVREFMEAEPNKRWNVVEDIADRRGLKTGEITTILRKKEYPSARIIERMIKRNQNLKYQANIDAKERHREQRQDKAKRKPFEVKTSVLSARMGKPFKIKFEVTDEDAKIIEKKLNDINRKLRKTLVKEAKSRIYGIKYQNVRPDSLSARETMLVVDEEKRINVNRLHFAKVKHYTPLILDSQLNELDKGKLKITLERGTPKWFPILMSDNPKEKIRTENQLKKYYKKKIILKIYYPEKHEETKKYTGVCYADMFITQNYPHQYNPNSIIVISIDPKKLIYQIDFYSKDGVKLRKTKEEGVKGLINEIRKKEFTLVPPHKDNGERWYPESIDDYEKYEKERQANLKKYRMWVERKKKTCLERKIEYGVFKAIEELAITPVIIISYTKFFNQINSPDKDWNFAQNKQMYIGKFKQILTGMAWRNGLEVLQLGEEDTKTYIDEITELIGFTLEMIKNEQELREQNEKKKQVRQVKAQLSKKLAKKLGRKPTDEEKRNLYKEEGLIEDSEGEK